MSSLSYAVSATLVVVLEANRGEWYSVPELGAIMALPREKVREHLEHLVIGEEVEVRRHPVGPDCGQIEAARIAPALAAAGAEPAPFPRPPAAEAPWNAVNGLRGDFSGPGTTGGPA